SPQPAGNEGRRNSAEEDSGSESAGRPTSGGRHPLHFRQRRKIRGSHFFVTGRSSGERADLPLLTSERSIVECGCSLCRLRRRRASLFKHVDHPREKNTSGKTIWHRICRL